MSSEPVVNSRDVMTEGLSGKTLAQFAEHALKRTAWAAIEWISHCLIVAIVLLGMRGIEIFVHWLWPTGLTFPGQITLHGLISTADLILLCGILILGIACVVKAYRGSYDS